MLPGPKEILECPHCKAREIRSTLLSGNTFGATAWTDGKLVAPMLPDQPFIARCKSCGMFYWLDEAEVVESYEVWDENIDSTLPRIRWPNSKSWLDAIDSEIFRDAEEEMTLRLNAWWTANNRYRDDNVQDGKKKVKLHSVRERGNMEWLMDNLPVDRSENVLMRAELARELGFWDRATQELDREDFADDYLSIVEQMRHLIAAQDIHVRPLSGQE